MIDFELTEFLKIYLEVFKMLHEKIDNSFEPIEKKFYDRCQLNMSKEVIDRILRDY